MLLVPNNYAVFHDERHLSQERDVLERITRHGNDIRRKSNLQRTSFFIDIE
jgi:hypothetical protein